jgi:AcrR family transcriptional regulator
VTEPVWTKPPPGSRRPRVSREQIAAAALAIADAEGIDKVSMRRVAAEVGLGTMSLYHYAPSKHDLLVLIGDAIMNELILPEQQLDEGGQADWKTRLALIARHTRTVWRRHPWAFSFMSEVRLGPNGMRNLEQSLTAVADLPLGAAEKLDLVSAVEGFVVGFVLSHGDLKQEPSDRDDVVAALAAWVTEQLSTGSFPQAERVLADPDPETVIRQLSAESNNDERFERELTWLLDGIDLHLSQSANVLPR